MPPEALWRGVVEMVGDVGHGKAGVLEQPCSPNEARAREILLGRGQLCPKEAAHQRARKYVETARKHPDRTDVRRGQEQRFEEAPAVWRNSGEIEGQLHQRLALNVFPPRGEEIVAKFPPAVCVADVNELATASRSQRKPGVGRRPVELRE